MLVICYNKDVKSWLKNNKVVITGASSGIGKELAKILIKKYDCFVLGVGRNQEKLQAFKEELGDLSSRFDYIAKDVSKHESWADIFEKAKINNCKILINNAGTMHPFMRADKIEMETLEKVFKTNFYSVVYGYKTFCDYFRNKKECAIINITSASALCAIPGESIYSASKSAATSFSRIVSSEEHNKLFIATYLPGFTKTNLFDSKDNSKPIFDKKATKLLNKFSVSSDKLAKKIIKNINKRKRYKKFGVDASVLKLLNSIAPTKSSDLYLKIFKKSKFKCFEDIFD